MFRVSQYEVQLIVENTKKLLVLLYGSVNRYIRRKVAERAWG